jgi:hypothetical protein
VLGRRPHSRPGRVKLAAVLIEGADEIDRWASRARGRGSN